MPRGKQAAAEPDVIEEAARIFQPVTVDGLYYGSNGQPLPLAGRIAAIIRDLPDVKPEGRNDFHKYKFITSDQVLGLLRPRLSRQCIIIYPERVTEQDYIEITTQKGGRSMITRLHVVFRIVDGLTGESFTGEAVGYGDDSGDKGANKAFTAANKNFMIKLFEIGGESDIEEDIEVDRRASAREAGVERAREVVLESAEVGNVARGGRSDSATDAQVSHVSRLVSQNGVSKDAFVKMLDDVLGLPVAPETEWAAVRTILSGLSGTDIGKVIQALS